jgi:hypothetical protein
MNRTLATVFSAVLLGAAGFAHADPAVYLNGKLTIPNGAIVTPDRQDYFTDIVLTTDAQGRLSITQATKATLASIDEVEAVVEDDVLTLEISGETSWSCVGLREPAIAYTNVGVLVLLAEESVPEDAACAAVMTPFTTEVEVSLADIDGDELDVRVNDFDLTVELP